MSDFCHWIIKLHGFPDDWLPSAVSFLTWNCKHTTQTCSQWSWSFLTLTCWLWMPIIRSYVRLCLFTMAGKRPNCASASKRSEALTNSSSSNFQYANTSTDNSFLIYLHTDIVVLRLGQSYKTGGLKTNSINLYIWELKYSTIRQRNDQQMFFLNKCMIFPSNFMQKYKINAVFSLLNMTISCFFIFKKDPSLIH